MPALHWWYTAFEMVWDWDYKAPQKALVFALALAFPDITNSLHMYRDEVRGIA